MNGTLLLGALPLLVFYVAARRFVLPALREMSRSLEAASKPDDPEAQA